MACAPGATAIEIPSRCRAMASLTVEKLDGNFVALSLSRGISLVARLDSEPRVNSVAKGFGSDLKAGSHIR
jgi:hypothetical protein